MFVQLPTQIGQRVRLRARNEGPRGRLRLGEASDVSVEPARSILAAVSPLAARCAGFVHLHFLSEKCIQISDMTISHYGLYGQILSAITSGQAGYVWTPADFARLGSRDAIDKALQRLVSAGDLRRIDRGLYDRPRINTLTKRVNPPYYRQVLDAIARRDQVRLLIDGLTAANDLGLTDAVPARVPVHTDARRKDIRVGGVTIQFKPTASSRLYWAGRPGMRVVQALHWLKNTLPDDYDRIVMQIKKVVSDRRQGKAVRDDLRSGFRTLPAWMQPVIRDVLDGNVATTAASPQRARRVHARRRTATARPPA